MKNLAIRAETIRTLGVESAPRPCPTRPGALAPTPETAKYLTGWYWRDAQGAWSGPAPHGEPEARANAATVASSAAR